MDTGYLSINVSFLMAVIYHRIVAKAVYLLDIDDACFSENSASVLDCLFHNLLHKFIYVFSRQNIMLIG